jgi:hypothetical protein
MCIPLTFPLTVTSAPERPASPKASGARPRAWRPLERHTPGAHTRNRSPRRMARVLRVEGEAGATELTAEFCQDTEFCQDRPVVMLFSGDHVEVHAQLQPQRRPLCSAAAGGPSAATAIPAA